MKGIPPQVFEPVTPSLPLSFVFRKVDSRWQVNLKLLYKKLPDTKGHRAVWYNTSKNMVKKLPYEFKRLTREINAIEAEDIKHGAWISAESALVLLIYGSRNTRHADVITWVEQYTGVHLPRQKYRSRRESVFAHSLQEFIKSELNEVSYGEYKLGFQHKLLNGKYYADFIIRHYWDGVENTNKFHSYLIEFDEEEHFLKASRERDEKRDAEIKKTHPKITLIRVRHDETDQWFQLIKDHSTLVGMESAYLSGIIAACKHANAQEMIIDSMSARKAYSYDFNDFAELLNYPKQPLRGISEALKRCGICFKVTRTRRHRQLALDIDSLSMTLHRWWGPEVAKGTIQRLLSQ